MRALSIMLAIKGTRCGHIDDQIPTAMASVETLENPHKAYVAMVRDRSWRETRRNLNSDSEAV